MVCQICDPIRDMARAENLSSKTVSNIVYASHERGMLSNARQGKPGGELTSKALDLLRGDSNRRTLKGADDANTGRATAVRTARNGRRRSRRERSG